MLYMDLRRWQMEEAAEADLLAIAAGMIPDEPGADDLKAARDYLPTYFGGLFPNLGLVIDRTEGESRYADKPDRPGLLVGRMVVFYPSMPARGAAVMQDDRTGYAKRLTRRVRGQFIERIYSSKLAPYFTVRNSRGGDQDELGRARTDEKGQSILWLDQTEFEITV